VTVGLPAGFSLSFSYVPPVRVFHVKTALYAMSLNRPLIEGESLTVGMRLFAQAGNVRGSFTCPGEHWHEGEYQDWGCEEASKDTMRTQTFGAELAAAYRVD